MLLFVRNVRCLAVHTNLSAYDSQTDILSRYHTVMNHSQKMDAFGAQLDFQGVILLMWGATVPLLYYGFYCDFTLQRTYSTLVRTSNSYSPTC